ncbi:methyltransferase small [Catenovulum agarivorans DS-2]|uniref:Methyltransferase small n=1 Tax=Catenovulum agarivorans DS-2 TaxID=1328313 RepID=W7QCI2_9ALTE|nr:methyltransferase [Catenovulum agarivorans]EWH09611.1 methyltransferase small [Catenovulum agarivorans DS-2]
MTQLHSAMKVGTDSLILGSWAIASVNKENTKLNVLDIGCGTGLLTLMLAQKLAEVNGQFTAVELDAGACVDAQYNFSQSPWSQCIQLFNCDIQSYPDITRFQRIICNPPYFTAGQTIEQSRAVARLQTHLNWHILAEQISLRLSYGGFAELVFPFSDLVEVKQIFSQVNLFSVAELHIYPKESDTSAKRVCVRFEKTAQNRTKMTIPEVNQLVIYNQQNHYTTDYRNLCRDYYLNF